MIIVRNSEIKKNEKKQEAVYVQQWSRKRRNINLNGLKFPLNMLITSF